MGYAGITGSTDVQSVSDPYFHWYTIQQVTNYVKTTSCQVNTNTGNSIPTVSAGPNFTIPRGTPFALEGTASDNDIGDILTYCWEQADEMMLQLLSLLLIPLQAYPSGRLIHQLIINVISRAFQQLKLELQLGNGRLFQMYLGHSILDLL